MEKFNQLISELDHEIKKRNFFNCFLKLNRIEITSQIYDNKLREIENKLTELDEQIKNIPQYHLILQLIREYIEGLDF